MKQLAFLIIGLVLTSQQEGGTADSVDVPQLQPWSERSHCPSLDMLNAASRYYHSDIVETAFVDDAYAERRKGIDLPRVSHRSDIRRLEASSDSLACKRLNRWFEVNILYDADYVFDPERNAYLPYAYPMYYQVGDRYTILFASYNAGRFKRGLPPPPIPGRTIVYVFDSSFRKVGQFSL